MDHRTVELDENFVFLRQVRGDVAFAYVEELVEGSGDDVAAKVELETSAFEGVGIGEGLGSIGVGVIEDVIVVTLEQFDVFESRDVGEDIIEMSDLWEH